MKKIELYFALIAVSILSVLFNSCNVNCKSGSGHQITQMRPVTPFTEISISGSYRLVLKQDTGYSVKITGDDNLLDQIKSGVSGNRLDIHNDGTLCIAKQIVVTIGMHDLSLLQTAGNVTVESDGTITTKDLNFKLAGATKITMDLSAANVNTDGSGLSELNLKGQASSHTVSFSGSGKLNALDFIVAKYDIESSGISDCKINVLSSLTVNSSGASNVAYRGNPTEVNNSKSGAGSVTKIN